MKKQSKNVRYQDLRFAILATDVVVFKVEDNKLKVLLVEVNLPDFYPPGTLGVPGGVISADETAEESVIRHLKEKGGLTNVFIDQLYTFSALQRDPRNRVVSVAYMGVVPSTTKLSLTKYKARWHAVNSLPRLAYDHQKIVAVAIERLRAKLGYTTIASGFLNKSFTLSELQHVYEVVFGQKFDKRNFRKKIIGLGCLKKSGRQNGGVAHRPAELYEFTTGGQEICQIL